MRSPNIDITIDEIVLHGVEPGQDHAFARAFDATLASLVRESAADALTWQSRQESSRRTAIVTVPDADGSSLGDAAAVKVAETLSQGGRT